MEWHRVAEDNTGLLLLSSGGQKSEIKMQDHVLQTCRGGSFLASSSFCWHQVPLACGIITVVSACLHMAIFPLCVSSLGITLCVYSHFCVLL